MSEIHDLAAIDTLLSSWEDAPRVEVSARPIFVVGSPASGTGVLHWSLAQHPSIMPLTDSRWISRFAVHLQDCYSDGVRKGATAQLRVADIDIDDFFAYFGEAINHLLLQQGRFRIESLSSVAGNGFRTMTEQDPRSPGPRRPHRWSDASPEMCFHIFDLIRLFPRAKFLHVWRDADAVVEALTDPVRKRLYYSEIPRMSEEAAYEYWAKSVAACLEAERAFGSDTIMRVRRDDLVNAPESVLRSCCEFLEEPFADICLRPLR